VCVSRCPSERESEYRRKAVHIGTAPSDRQPFAQTAHRSLPYSRSGSFFALREEQGLKRRMFVQREVN
jgi:hypothetical protein